MLEETRQRLETKQMVMHLHDVARTSGNDYFRKIADRLAQLQKEIK